MASPLTALIVISCHLAATGSAAVTAVADDPAALVAQRGGREGGGSAARADATKAAPFLSSPSAQRQQRTPVTKGRPELPGSGEALGLPKRKTQDQNLPRP